MLRKLTVENYALIDHLEMELDERLNIITGETGAGKSILLGALGLIIGNKNEGAAIKSNSSNCVIEGEFEIAEYDLKSLFEEFDWEYEDSLTIRRVITPAGKSRAFVNDMPVQLAELKVLGTRLIDIHSQHKNRDIINESYRLAALDGVAGAVSLFASYKSDYKAVVEARRALQEAEEILASSSKDEDWLKFQVSEFEVIKLRAGEVADIETELSLLENADRISAAFSQLQGVLDGDEMGSLVMLKGCEGEFRSLSHQYAPAGEYAERLFSVIEELKDISASASSDLDGISTDGERLNKLSSRLDAIYSLQQKHRAQTPDDLLAIEADFRNRLECIVNSDEHIVALKNKVLEAEKKAMAVAAKLHTSRTKAAKKLSSQIESLLVKLGLPDAKFVVQLSKGEQLTQNGFDQVEFLFSANKGQAEQSIDKVASGGEISRIMLALKSIIAQTTNLPTIIFDEIDTGVSGRVASAMGDIISSLSADMQVIDITHLPQVAAKGSTHFMVYKEASKTNIVKLDDEERVKHIATLLSADAVTAAALVQARNLLENR